jgi:hypothetical protein
MLKAAKIHHFDHILSGLPHHGSVYAPNSKNRHGAHRLIHRSITAFELLVRFRYGLFKC